MTGKSDQHHIRVDKDSGLLGYEEWAQPSIADLPWPTRKLMQGNLCQDELGGCRRSFAGKT